MQFKRHFPQQGSGVTAAWLAQVAWVWRRGVGRGLPRAFQQADLDLVAPAGQAPIAAAMGETECIKAAVQVLEQLPEGDSLEIRLGHCALLEAVLRLCLIPHVRSSPPSA